MAEKITNVARIKSSYYGDLEVQPDNIFYFKNGMLGFDSLNNFVLISDDDIAPFKWLMAIEEPEIMFPVVSPYNIDPNYNPGKDIGLDKFVLFVVVTLNDGEGNMTANMKAPVVLNSLDLTGEQRILTFEKYSVNHLIKSKEQ